MDIKEYISSGILQSYVLGAVSDQERQEVECMSHIYPEIKTELTQLQQDIEDFAMAHALAPSEKLKAKILAAISNEEQVVGEPKLTNASSKVISMPQRPASTNYLKWGIAASTLVTIGLSILLVYFQNSWNTEHSKVLSLEKSSAQLLDEKNRLNEELITLEDKLTEEASTQSFLADAQTSTIELKGTENSPESQVNIYWNKTNSQVMMQVKNLPEPPTNKQYQLWAIVDGVPVDMGVFDIATNKSQLQKIPINVSSAAAFAITLEQKGGVKVPTLTAMYVIGNSPS